MAVFTDREHFIPLRCADLVELLCTEKGPGADQKLTPPEQQQLRRFAGMLAAHYHHEYRSQLERLKDAYAPFDPDADTRPLRPPTDEERDAARDRLFDEFVRLLEKANYRHMTREEILKTMEGASDWGIDMDVDWEVFDRLEMFYRGDVMGRRSMRRWWKLWKLEWKTVPTFQRMVLILKQKPHKRLGPEADTRSVFLKLFKDIPKMDLEMLLPGTKLKMPKIERGKLGASILSSIGYVVYRVLSVPAEVFVAAMKGTVTLAGAVPLVGPVALVLGYGYKTWAGFQVTKQTYEFQLTQSLYYQNLDNNGGVLYRLLDEAEEQENREALLAYFFLWRYAGERGWTAEELDDYVELDLEKRLNMKVDFEIEDALGKLERLNLIEKVEGRYRVPPIEKAMEILAGIWQSSFRREGP